MGSNEVYFDTQKHIILIKWRSLKMDSNHILIHNTSIKPMNLIFKFLIIVNSQKISLLIKTSDSCPTPLRDF